MRQVCVERALPSSIEIRRFAHTNFLANELPARDLWKAKRPGGAFSARRKSRAAVQVSRSSRRPSATSWAMRLPARALGRGPRVRGSRRPPLRQPAALRSALPVEYQLRHADGEPEQCGGAAGDQQYRFEKVHCAPPQPRQTVYHARLKATLGQLPRNRATAVIF